MAKRSAAFKKFFYSEDGQGTVEYVLLLLILVGIFLSVGRELFAKVQDFFITNVAGGFNRTYFDARNMYRFNLGMRR